MTVCIGAICEDGNTAVVAADKMVTFGAPMSLQMEPATLKKITQLNSEPAVLLFLALCRMEKKCSPKYGRP